MELKQLRDIGSKLHNLPISKDALIKLLKQASTALSEFGQSPPKSVLVTIQPFLNAIIKPELLKHQDREVKLLVATCICEITRITAPEAPYSDDVLRDIFRLIVNALSGLSENSGPSFGRRVVILETMARYRTCVVMLDLECDDLVDEMFSMFLAVASDQHSESVINSMQMIMVALLVESEDVRDDLLFVLLSVLGRNKHDITMTARRLAMKVIEKCAGKLESGIRQFLISSMSEENRSLKFQIDYHEVIYDIYRCAPQVLSGVVPYISGELLADKLHDRLKAVELVGDLFALPESAIPETFQPMFLEFLKRLTDRAVEVRMSVLKHLKTCLLSSPSRAKTPEIFSALCDRLLDYDENVRKQVVDVVCDVACHAPTSVPVDILKLVAERLRDKSALVKKYTLDRLAEMYRIYCSKFSDGSFESGEYDWIVGKILRCFYDKDFRSDTVETILFASLFPIEFSVKDKVGNWIRVFSGFDKIEVKALERILEHKHRLQQEMLRYLSLRQMYQMQNNDANELQKKVMFCFRIMSRCFNDPVKAEENFMVLDQLKDANVWKIMATLLDPNTSSLQACRSRDDLLKILGEKHRLYEFLSILSMKCSYILFNKEHVKEILLEANIQKSAANEESTLSCMNILVVLAFSTPLLLSGIEKDLVHLLEDDNEVIKEGVLHVLAKAGGTIREQLGVSSSSLDLILERMCLEGSRRQAKYAVHALAAITKDDGLKSLSVLYKRLVNMLEEKTHLPAVLQSLGCIAETAMPVFETREKEVEGFIKRNILECSHKLEDKSKECLDARSVVCTLKIFGIKMLVKSYLPIKDAHLRLGIDDLIGILKNILSFGDISKDIDSSSTDKAHLRLAAAKAVLRLSKHWDNKISIDLFYLILRTLEVCPLQLKRLFLIKVHRYIKDRLLDPKYAIAFLFDIGSHGSVFEEDKHNLRDIIQICQQGKARQLTVQCDGNSPFVYPEYILPYLVHALAHHSSCPIVDECKDVKAFEQIYRKLYFFLSMLVHGHEDGKSETSLKKEKDDISLLISIFQSIKCSDDAVDAKRSKNSFAICDLGLSIIKRLARKQDDLEKLIVPAPLPLLLYKPHDNNKGNAPMVSKHQTWLADGSALAHFESLKLEANGTLHSEITEDEALKDSEIDFHEEPLSKLIKRLKAKGNKTRKVVKNELPPSGEKNENNVDILKMVREINIDNLDLSSKNETNIGHKSVPRKTKSDEKHQKRKRTNDNLSQDEVSSSELSEMDEQFQSVSEDKMFSQEIIIEPIIPDLLAPCYENSSLSSTHKRRRSDRVRNDEFKVDENHDNGLKTPKKLSATDSINTISNSKSGSVKKQKRRSIVGLAQCKSKDGVNKTTDLVGCRVKIWWPMDKQFYEGVVKSYSREKRKHVVLYNDGEKEVLRMDRERWEFVDNSHKPVKQLKHSTSSPPEGVLSEPTKKSSSGSHQYKKLIIKSPSTKVSRKRTPLQRTTRGKSGVSKSRSSFDFIEDESDSDLSHHESATVFKVDNLNTEDKLSGEEQSGKDKLSGDVDDSKEKCEVNQTENVAQKEGKQQAEDVSRSDSRVDDDVSENEPLVMWQCRARKSVKGNK